MLLCVMQIKGGVHPIYNVCSVCPSPSFPSFPVVPVVHVLVSHPLVLALVPPAVFVVRSSARVRPGRLTLYVNRVCMCTSLWLYPFLPPPPLLPPPPTTSSRLMKVKRSKQVSLSLSLSHLYPPLPRSLSPYVCSCAAVATRKPVAAFPPECRSIMLATRSSSSSNTHSTCSLLSRTVKKTGTVVEPPP